MPLIPVDSSFIPVTEEPTGEGLFGSIIEPHSGRGVLPQVGRQIAGSAVEGFAGLPETVGRLGQAIQRRATGKASADKEYGFLNLADAIREAAAEVRGEIDPDVSEGFWTGDVPRALGSTASFLVGGAASKVLGLGPAVGAATLGAGAGGAEGFRRAKAAGSEDDEAFTSLLLNAGLGTTEALPIARIFGRLNKATGGRIKQAIASGTEEAIQETIQNIGGNAIAQAVTDEDVGLLENTLRSGGAGGVSGFLIQAVLGGRRANPAKLAGKALEEGVESSESDIEGAAMAAMDPRGAQQTLKERPDYGQRNRASLLAAEGGRLPGGRGTETGTTTDEAVEPQRRMFYVEAGEKLKEKFRSGARIDGGQLRNTLKNSVTPGEFLALEEAGLAEFLKERRTPEEVERWVEERGPRVETKELYAQNKTDPRSLKHAQLTHEFFDTLSVDDKSDITQFVREPDLVNYNTGISFDEYLKGKPAEFAAKAKEFVDVSRDILQNPPERAASSESATARFTTVNPKPLDKMPGAVDLLVRIPTPKPDKEGRFDVPNVVKYNAEQHYPTEGKNLLAHVRGYMEDRGGKKVFHVSEVQSDWAQARHKVEDRFTIVQEGGLWKLKDKEGKLITPYSKDRKEVERFRDGIIKNDPLLKHYERLALKAAIDHARKRGADAIALSDAETAMITEGHDKAGLTPDQLMTHEVGPETSERFSPKTGNYYVYWKEPFEGSQPYQPKGFKVVRPGGAMSHGGDMPHIRKFNNQQEAYDFADKLIKRIGPQITQEKGMRLHYDRTLPKIMEELTGEKGEVVDFGEHQNVYEDSSRRPDTDEPYPQGRHRPDLIFRNPDGTPKTSITARLYPIGKARKTFSLFGSDKAGTPTAKKGLQVKPGKKQSQAGFLRLPKGLRPKRMVPLAPSHVPDFRPWDEVKDTASRLFGAEKIPGLGNILGGRGAWAGVRPRIVFDYDKAIAGWYELKHGTSSGIASALGEQIRGEVNDAFKANKKGDLNVIKTSPDQSLKISDVFEGLQKNRNAYKLTPEQRRVYNNIIDPVMKRIAILISQYKLVTAPDDIYFMRGNAKPPKGKKHKARSRRVFGARQGFQQERMFDTEQEGWNQGYTYSLDIEARMVQGVESMYKAIADKRLATDPAMGGQTMKQLINSLRLSYPMKSPEQINRMARAIRDKRRVNSVHFKRIYSQDVTDMLNRELSFDTSRTKRAIANTNSFLKAVKLGFDFGAPLIQLAPLATFRPLTWVKANVLAFHSFLNREGFSLYARNNTEAIQEWVQYGGRIGRLEDYMEGLGSTLPAVLDKTVIGKPAAGAARAFGRHFQSAIDIAKIELWKAHRKVAPKDKWPSIIQGIESVLMSGRMESAMVSQNRSLWERTIFNAPMYYRGAINFATLWATEKGTTRWMGIQALGQFVAGSIFLYIAMAMRAGMDDEEIEARLDPDRPDFMMWTVSDEKGDQLNVGIGGVLRSFVRLGAESMVAENWNSVTKNPLVKWVRSHSSPFVHHAWNLAQERDFLGRDVTVRSELAGTLPLAIESSSKAEFVAQMAGLSAWPRSPSAQEVAKEVFGTRDIESLKLGERRKLAKEVDERQREETPAEKKRSARFALETTLRRQEAVNEGVSKANRTFLEEHGLTLPGFQASQTILGQRVPMTKPEQKFYQEVLVEEYNTAVDRLRAQDWTTLTPKQKEFRMRRLTDFAKRRAQGRLARARREGTIE